MQLFTLYECIYGRYDMKDNSKSKKTTRKKNKDQYRDFSSGKASSGRPLQANKKKEAGAKSGSDIGRRVSSGNPAAGKGSFSGKPGAGKDPARKADPAKKKSRCPVSALCGGCTMINIPYDEQIRSKQETLVLSGSDIIYNARPQGQTCLRHIPGRHSRGGACQILPA